MMMHPDDEETGFPMTEQQNAYAVSQLTTDRDPDRAEIAAIVAAGRFAVASRSLDHCRFTDATLPGTTRRLRREIGGAVVTHADAEGAIAALRALLADEDRDDEVDLVIVGPGADAINAAMREAAMTAMLGHLDEVEMPF